jgi:SAM-dependent MidA family methyltransferase
VVPAEPITGVVLANELFDNVPFRLLVFDGAWREAFVDAQGDRFVEVLSPRPFCEPTEATLGAVASQNWLPAQAPHGTRVPVQESSANLLEQLRSVVINGRVVAVDYTVARTAELLARPWRSWLRTYRGHETGAHFLVSPGSQDITAEVCLDQLPVADALRTQAQFLQRWGIDDLVEEGRQAWAAAAARPTLASLQMRSRVREAEALCDPAGLGAFTVVEWLV